MILTPRRKLIAPRASLALPRPGLILPPSIRPRRRRHRRRFSRLLSKWLRLPFACSGCGHIVCCCNQEEDDLFYQAQRCSDNLLVDLWFGESYFGDTPPTAESPYYFRQDGVCYLVTGETTDAEPGTIAAPDAIEISDCSDEACCGEDLCDCNRESLSFTVSLAGLSMCTHCMYCAFPGVFGSYKHTGGSASGTYSLSYNATRDWWCYQDSSHFQYDVFDSEEECTTPVNSVDVAIRLVIQLSEDCKTLSLSAAMGTSFCGGFTAPTCSETGPDSYPIMSASGCAQNGMLLTDEAHDPCPGSLAPLGTGFFSGTPVATVTWDC